MSIRFWERGYWRNHLGNRRYHISALYVVDLLRFRQLAAGDRLRGQYQALSQDPNSLANLDQDLPNNMIHQVPIKSLPQEWLWCETWCSESSKSAAKTIDLVSSNIQLNLQKGPSVQRTLVCPQGVPYLRVTQSFLERKFMIEGLFRAITVPTSKICRGSNFGVSGDMQGQAP